MIELRLDDPRWADVLRDETVERIARTVFDRLGLSGEIEGSLLGCDDAQISALNAEFREKASPTNVLSWPAEDLEPPDLPKPDPDGVIELGDIAMAYETCAREAAEQDKTLSDHSAHLVVHGLLHLLGYDHERDEDATLMEGLEKEILGKLGIKDPY
ncbi:MAG: rRNA maturation RNase YbeY [Pseudomonadota bacterium]